MGWRVTWCITCDQCGKAGPRRYKGKRPATDAAKAAFKAGWIACVVPADSSLAHHLCPQCAAGPRPEWWSPGEEGKA